MGTELQAKYQKLAQEYAKVTKLHILSVFDIGVSVYVSEDF